MYEMYSVYPDKTSTTKADMASSGKGFKNLTKAIESLKAMKKVLLMPKLYLAMLNRKPLMKDSCQKLKLKVASVLLMLISSTLKYLVRQGLSIRAVSYTHLDVYKRQASNMATERRRVDCWGGGERKGYPHRCIQNEWLHLECQHQAAYVVNMSYGCILHCFPFNGVLCSLICCKGRN